MRIIRYNENLLEQCVEFWWSLYEQKPYIVRPDGYQDINNPPVACDVFRENLRSGLNGGPVRHWRGIVTPDSIILAEDNGKIAGMLVCSVDRENLVGTILSGFMHQDQSGREIANRLVSEALEYFRELGLRKAVVGPSYALEVERPLHIAVIEAGFAWEESWDQPGGHYGVVMGMWFHSFELSDEIKRKIEELRKQGITFRKVTLDELRECRRLDNDQPPEPEPNAGPCYGAFVGDHLVGWLAWVCICGLEVIPSYRRKGIGTVLLHLLTDELAQGCEIDDYDCTVVGVTSPARVLLHSAGFQYWYLGYGGMSMDL